MGESRRSRDKFENRILSFLRACPAPDGRGKGWFRLIYLRFVSSKINSKAV